MTYAVYGRMSIGRCMPQSLGYIGCSTDALPFLNKHCSNRQECQFLVFSLKKERLFEDVCATGLEMYLSASYYCEKGTCKSYKVDALVFKFYPC